MPWRHSGRPSNCLGASFEILCSAIGLQSTRRHRHLGILLWLPLRGGRCRFWASWYLCRCDVLMIRGAQILPTHIIVLLNHLGGPGPWQDKMGMWYRTVKLSTMLDNLIFGVDKAIMITLIEIMARLRSHGHHKNNIIAYLSRKTGGSIAARSGWVHCFRRARSSCAMYNMICRPSSLGNRPRPTSTFIHGL